MIIKCNCIILGNLETLVFYAHFFRGDVNILDYVIKSSRNVYIKLNENGTPVTCTDSEKGLFEFSKARNICEHLPKPLKRLVFKVEPIPDIIPKEENTEKKVIQNQNYIPSEDITRWIEKFGICSDILQEAKQREKELIEELNNCDKGLLDILHSIELEGSKDMYGGWKEYKKMKENRQKRRNIKDELLIVENVLKEINPECMQRERVKRAIDGLFTRKYSFRIVEECDENADL